MRGKRIARQQYIHITLPDRIASPLSDYIGNQLDKQQRHHDEHDRADDPGSVFDCECSAQVRADDVKKRGGNSELPEHCAGYRVGENRCD